LSNHLPAYRPSQEAEPRRRPAACRGCTSRRLEKIRDALEAIEFLQASQRSNGGGPGIRRRP
jgi:hypothetical protein